MISSWIDERCQGIATIGARLLRCGLHGSGCIVNVGTYEHGFDYGSWVSIDGWSEAILEFIREHEADAGRPLKPASEFCHPEQIT